MHICDVVKISTEVKPVPVAHRLRTVIDYDRLIVLDKGQVNVFRFFPSLPADIATQIAEFDTPLNLIQKDDGIFRNMCLKSGTFTELEAEAKVKAERDLVQEEDGHGR